MDKKIQEIYNYIILNKLIKSDDLVIVGFSGGADSTALLYILDRLKDMLGISIYACHIHHGIRGFEADEDLNFVESFCKKRNIEYKIYMENIPKFAKEKSLSLEEAGRIKRYADFFDLATTLEKKRNKNIKIAIAHNKNDNVETIILNLLRGSGLKGLAGISLKRKNIIRPLLDTKRSDIEILLKDKNINYRTDSTNLSDDYTRNIIRHKIINIFTEQINAASIDHIIRGAKFIGEADEFIVAEAKKLEEDLFIYEDNKLVGFKFEKLKNEAKILRTYFIRSFLAQILKKLKDIEFVHIEKIDELIFMDTGKSLNLPYNLKLYKNYNSIIQVNERKVFVDKNLNLSGLFSLRVFESEDFEIPDLKYTKYIDYDRIIEPLSFRVRQSGDYIYIKNGKKSVKAFMIDEKIEKNSRDEIPLVCIKNDIIWIVGKRLSEAYKVNKNTKKILEITYKKGN